MGSRPNYINIRDDDLDAPQPPRPPFYLDLPSPLPSPRTGEVPPALSPLDAFAMHSRLLAKRFEEASQDGKRISRLPPKDVAEELANRPNYFRSASRAGGSPMSEVPELREDVSPSSSQKPGVVENDVGKDRPLSQYPLVGYTGKKEKEFDRQLSTQYEDEPPVSASTPQSLYDGSRALPSSRPSDYFGFPVPRAQSPEPADTRTIHIQTASPTVLPSSTNSVDSVQSTQVRSMTNGSARSQRSLAPPRSPAFPKSPRSMQSVRSVAPDSGDDDASITGSYAISTSRKFSGSSNMSRPQSPLSPWMNPLRSPSTMSDYSVNGSQKRNFSRPLSSGIGRTEQEARPSFDSRSSFETRPSTDLPLRKVSADSISTKMSSALPSRQGSQDDDGTPNARELSRPLGFPTGTAAPDRPKTSYTYASYALPRGRVVERDSAGSTGSWIQKQFQWDEETAAGRPPPKARKRSNSDPVIFEPPPPRVASPATSEKMLSQRQERLAREREKTASSMSRSRSAEPKTFQKANAIHKSSPSVRTHGTDSTDRTIRPIPLHQRSSSAEMTPDEHLDLGIQAHDEGALNKSTYHLRLAAKAGLPTAMLLYALACRHGWGMRPNQEEGVVWLRKAIDTAGLEVADVEATLASASRSGKTIDPATEMAERRKRKAQFALATYELGISYMNGWGCAKDKMLGLRCYEVAGNWGDCDALAEAAFCYTQGQGCKKDLKKAAALYRKAAEGGMSMAGNSW